MYMSLDVEHGNSYFEVRSEGFQVRNGRPCCYITLLLDYIQLHQSTHDYDLLSFSDHHCAHFWRICVVVFEVRTQREDTGLILRSDSDSAISNTLGE